MELMAIQTVIVRCEPIERSALLAWREKPTMLSARRCNQCVSTSDFHDTSPGAICAYLAARSLAVYSRRAGTH